MTVRCPACRAENSEGPLCRRCRADLTLLFQLHEQRQAMFDTACRFLSQHQLRRALAVAEGIDAMRRDEDSLKLLAICHLLLRNFADALRYRTMLTRCPKNE